MTIEMNIEYLLKNKITANQFLVLQLILEKQDDRLGKFKEVIGEDEYAKIIESLILIGFLIKENDKLQVTKECLRTFKGKGYFEELYLKFPVSVVRPDGKRESLRTARKQCERKYRNLAKRKDTHEHILKCLEFEIKERTINDTLKFMKKMPNWLSSEVWKEYEEKMKVSFLIDNMVEEQYGTEII
jgi:hypothetical protein